MLTRLEQFAIDSALNRDVDGVLTAEELEDFQLTTALAIVENRAVSEAEQLLFFRCHQERENLPQKSALRYWEGIFDDKGERLSEKLPFGEALQADFVLGNEDGRTTIQELAALRLMMGFDCEQVNILIPFEEGALLLQDLQCEYNPRNPEGLRFDVALFEFCERIFELVHQSIDAVRQEIIERDQRPHPTPEGPDSDTLPAPPPQLKGITI